MMKKFIVILLFCSCNSTKSVDVQAIKREIMALQEDQRENHFKRNAKAMVELSSDSFLVVSNGKVNHPQRESAFKNFQDYFNSVEFIKWDDVKPPLIRVSDDGSVVYVAVEKIVVLRELSSANKNVLDTTYYGWISVYRKNGNKWELDAIASTDKRKL